MAFSIAATDNVTMAPGVSASANNFSDAGKVVVSLVRRLSKQETRTRYGDFQRLPTSVTDGSGKCATASRIRAIITPMSTVRTRTSSR